MIVEINEFSVSDEMLWVTGQTGRRQEDCYSDQSVRLYSDTVATAKRRWLPPLILLALKEFNFERQHSTLFWCSENRKKLFQLSIVESWHISHVHVRYMLSPVRLSSVSLSSVTFVHPTHAVVIFGNFSTAFGILAIHWHPWKISRRSSQGNPSVGGVKHNRGSQI